MQLKPLSSIQILRGLAAWMVVFHHYMQVFHHFESESSLGWFFSHRGSFGVDIFFVISGFIMYYTVTLRSYSAKTFLFGRIKRIIPAYWFFTFVLLCLTLLYPSAYRTEWNLLTLIKSLFFLPSINPGGFGTYPLLTVGWTLNFEMFFYLLLSLSMISFGRFRFVGCGIALVILPLIWPKDWLYSSVLSSPLLAEFTFGILIGFFYVRNDGQMLRNSPILGLLVLGLGVALLLLNLKILASGFFVISALFFEDHLPKLGDLKILKYLGNTSYSVYLVHTIILGLAMNFTGAPNNLWLDIALLTFLSLLIVAISHCSYRYIENNLPSVSGPLRPSPTING